MGLTPPNKEEQLTAIKHKLATASKVQKQLKEKFAYGENMFFDLDLLEYRIQNSRKVIAEELDVKSLYGVNENIAQGSVGSAFIGYDNKEFLPEYQFEGLFGEQLNDIIRESRYRINGRIGGQKAYKLGHGYHGRTAKERSEHSRKGNLAQGNHIWSLDELVSLHEIREESVGKGSFKTKPCMTYVTEKFNERHGTDFTKIALKSAYSQNKHRLSEAGFEIAEPFIWNLDKILSLHEIREESVGKGRYKTKPCMTYVTEKFNEQHGTDFSKVALKWAYSQNKHRLSEEE